jgi:DNA-binding XRE family transcriptional regulator/molybdate-binding protein
MSVSKALEPPNVYFALGSISGKTFVNEAAASTVGVDPPPPAPVFAAGAGIELEPLPAQAAASPDTASKTAAAGIRRAKAVTIKTFVLLVCTPESWHPNGIMATATRSSLRARRLECGFTQAELATRAGVSRQLIAAVEAGQNAPAVDAALGLARALATTVEALFASTPSDVAAALGGSLPEGASLRIGHVGDRLVAAELADRGVAGAGWANPDGIVQDGRLRLYPGAAPAGLVVAGCDPALGIAEALLAGLGPRSLLAISAPTGIALRALQQETVHAAVVHGIPRQLPKSPVQVIRWHLARWQVGLATAPTLPNRSLEAILDGGTPIAQRDPAAASQQALSRAVGRAGIKDAPPGPRATGHIDAARIAAAINGAAVTTEAAARVFDLRFLPLENHTVEIWLGQRWLDHPGAQALGDVLTSSAFTERVTQFAGYDLSGCGSRL